MAPGSDQNRYDPARIEQLFHAVVDLPASDRDVFLIAECGGHPEVLEFVRSLLAADQDVANSDIPVSVSADSLLESGLTGVWPDREPDDSTADDIGPGVRIGSYCIVREVGRGGMGTVYLAERADGHYEQQVAVKIIKAGFVDKALASRFLRERQILARLSHPSIARLLDGGLTPDRRPYLVMEYVDGEPITTYADRLNLKIRDRLALFLKVCDPVRSAHQSLIIHRDIKPSNILVTPTGQPKLLDFGIAKMLAEEDPYDHSGTLAILTPDYASPEQARGAPAGTPSDIYSLGTLLFELLAGRRPFAPASSVSAVDAMRALQEVEPPKPSDVAVRPADRRTLRGDLDKVVLHALQKDSARRYSSIEAFAADIQRYLDGFPVLAQSDSYRYRFGKFVRRRRAWVIAAVVALVFAVAGVAAIVRSAAIANAQRAKAERRFNEVRELAKSYVFELDSNLAMIPGTTKVRALMNKRAMTYLDRLSAEAGGDAELQRELASAYAKVAVVQGVPNYANVGDHASARASIAKAIQLRRDLVAANPNNSDDRLALASAISLLGQLEMGAGDPRAALRAHSEALREAESLLARTPQPTGRLLNVLAGTLESVAGDYGGNGLGAHLGNPVAAVSLLQRAMDVTLREGEAKAREGLSNAYRYSNQALVELFLGRLDSEELRRPAESIAHFEKAIQLLHTPGTDLANAEIRRKVLVTQMWWASALIHQREIARAQALTSSCVEMAAALLRADPDNLAARGDYSIVQILAGEVDALAGRGATGWMRVETGLDEHRKRLAADPADGVDRSALASLAVESGETALACRRFDIARRYFTEVAELAGGTVAAHPSDGKASMDLSAAEHGLAICFEHDGNAAAARQHDALAAAAARKVVDLYPDNPRAQALLADSLR